MYQIIVSHSPLPEDIQIIRNGMVASVEHKLGENAKFFSIFLKDNQGDIQGGIIAWLFCESVYIDIIWIQENLHNQDYGTKLLTAAEEEAIKLGYKYSTLDTFSFQAEGFYLKNGYQRMGEIKNYMANHSKISLRKKLV